MKLTIDNLDGKGPIDYSQTVVAEQKVSIRRQLNEPSLCSFTLAPAVAGLAAPVRNGRIILSDDSGNILFTGYLAMEPELQLLGQASSGPVYQAFLNAVSDEVLLDQQPLPLLLAGVSQSAGQLLQQFNNGLDTAGFTFEVAGAAGSIGKFLADPGKGWSANTGALAAIARSAYRAVDGVVTLAPIGSVTHVLSETNGTLNVSALAASLVKTLANDITVCGPSEPSAYVTEFFQGDGTTVLFDLTEEPYMPAASKSKPLIDLFNEPEIDTSVWNVVGAGTHVSLTSAGLTCTGGDGIDGDTIAASMSEVELGGAMVFEAGGVQFGAVAQGVLNGIYGGSVNISNCIAGFQISQTGGNTQIAALINGTASGSSFTITSGHMYTLRLRTYCNEMQRLQQAYNSVDNSGTHLYGGTFLSSNGSVVLEVQDTTDGVAGTPVVLYAGTLSNLPSTATLGLINSADLACSIASIEVSQQGPIWVQSTPSGGSLVVRRMGTTAQGADCRIERTGKLRFYPTSVPQAGELIAVSYRTTHRAVARLANAASIAQESSSGAIPGTAAWIGTVTSPAPRSSLDCENAASALLDLSTNRGAAWKGKYTAWNMEAQGDVWPGDVLAVSAASAGLNANLVVRTVEIELLCGVPGLAKYVVGFANDWADAISIKTSSAVPEDVWLPQQPETAAPLTSLAQFTAAVTGSAITVNAVAVPPTGGGFEVRRRDWAFGPGTNSDLVLRSPVNNFTIPREAAVEQYYVRMYDASTPPNYSRFSSAIFANVAL